MKAGNSLPMDRFGRYVNPRAIHEPVPVIRLAAGYRKVQQVAYGVRAMLLRPDRGIVAHLIWSV
jgi:hypothetical protein